MKGKKNFNIDLFPKEDRKTDEQSAANILLNAILNNDFDEFNIKVNDKIVTIKTGIFFYQPLDPQFNENIVLAQIFKNYNVDESILHGLDRLGRLKEGQNELEKPKQDPIDLVGLLSEIAENNKTELAPYFNKLDVLKDKKLLFNGVDRGVVDPIPVFEKVLEKNIPPLTEEFLNIALEVSSSFQKIQMLSAAKIQLNKDVTGKDLPKQEELKEQYNERVKIIAKDIDFAKVDKGQEAIVLGLPDKYVKKYLEKTELELNYNIIKALVSDRLDEKPPRSINRKLLDKIFEVENFVFDEKILTALSKRIALSPYLDKYIDKALDQKAQSTLLDSKEDVKNNLIKSTKFNHRIFGQVSIEQYQEKKKEIEVAVKGNDLNKLDKLIKNDLALGKIEKPVYILNEIKKQNDKKLYAKVVEDLIISPDLGFKPYHLNTLISTLDPEKDKAFIKEIGSVLYKNGVTKDVVSQLHNKEVNEILQESIEKAAIKKERYVEKADLKKDNYVELQKYSDEVVTQFNNSKLKDKEWENSVNTAVINLHNNLRDFGKDKALNAQMIINITKGVDLDSKKGEYLVNKLATVYNTHVRGEDINKHVPVVKMPQFNNMVKEVGGPENLGKLLYRDNYKNKDLQNLLKDEHAHKFDKATALLQANLKKTGLVISETDKQKVAEKALTNCSLKTMINVVRATEGYEDYSKKYWITKAVSRFVDAISRKFSGLKESVKNGLGEFMVNNGAVIKEKVQTKNIPQMKKTGHSK